MTYVTARQRALSGVGREQPRTYARQGFTPGEIVFLRSRGIPAAVGVDARAVWSDLDWLTSVFSGSALARLVQNGLTSNDSATLRTLSVMDLSRLRGYAGRTSLSVARIRWLMEAGLPSGQYARWTGRLPAEAQETVSLYCILQTATVLHGITPQDAAGWVRVANRARIPYRPELDEGRFLGGDTGLMVAAGVASSEADLWMSGGEVDREALEAMSALRMSTAGAVW